MCGHKSSPGSFHDTPEEQDLNRSYNIATWTKKKRSVWKDEGFELYNEI
jgi:hypothetical protein